MCVYPVSANGVYLVCAATCRPLSFLVPCLNGQANMPLARFCLQNYKSHVPKHRFQNGNDGHFTVYVCFTRLVFSILENRTTASIGPYALLLPVSA